MGEARHDGLAVPGHVILAHEPPFHIGDILVHPSTRQVERGNRQETLEPRVMQVLVALARAQGGIVTRDELIESCWESRVVGDDSINRVISRIRRLAARLGDGRFAVETIARVGYRLVPTGGVQGPRAGGPTMPVVSKVDRRMLVGGALALGSVAVAGGFAIWPGIGGRGGSSPKAKALFDQAAIIRPVNNRQALAYLQEAVRLSPEYGEAWGALAVSYRVAIDEETPERVAGFEERLQEAARNAERYDPGNADAAAALLLATSTFGKWSELEPVYRAAIRRHPDHPAAYSLLGTLLMDVGRWPDAVGILRSAKGRNPTSPVLRYKLIVSLWAAGQITPAENEIDEAMQLWPQHGAIWQTKVKLLALTGRPRQAIALVSDPAAQPLDEKDAPDMRGQQLFLKALASRSAGDVDRAVDALVVKAREMESNRLNAALQATALGRIGLALDMLEGVYFGAGQWALRSPATKWLSTHPLFQPHARPLWREPRFNRILSGVGLERYWKSTGTLPDYRRHGLISRPGKV
jgi:DNA-binding winged helix-turn-helix (wHTH) protein/tetratricopeptide (TPR) repeat protein